MKTANSSPARGQRGFTLVEMLMAAFVMAVGLLGLTSLQAMSIRAAGSSSRMQDAIRLAEQVLEQASSEGAQSYLGMKYTNPATSAYKYIGQGTVTDFYKYRTVADSQGDKGTLMPGTVADGVFTVTVNQAEVGTAGGFGQLTQFTVQVQFVEGVVSSGPAAGTAVQRTVSLSREVAHG